MPTKIALASDHAGFEAKQFLITVLKDKGFDPIDLGPFSDASVDYPDYAHSLAETVESGLCGFGIAICGSGNGISMAANKHSGIRSALCWKPEIASLARQHNDANICALPARFLSKEEFLAIVDVFLSTPFEGGRHQLRVEKIPYIK